MRKLLPILVSFILSLVFIGFPTFEFPFDLDWFCETLKWSIPLVVAFSCGIFYGAHTSNSSKDDE